MEILYANNKIKKLCSQPDKAQRELGKQCADYLFDALAHLYGNNSLFDAGQIKYLRLHPLTGNRKGEFSIDLEQPYRLIIEIPAEFEYTRSNLQVELKKVNRIIIKSIEDTHGRSSRKRK